LTLHTEQHIEHHPTDRIAVSVVQRFGDTPSIATLEGGALEGRTMFSKLRTHAQREREYAAAWRISGHA